LPKLASRLVEIKGVVGHLPDCGDLNDTVQVGLKKALKTVSFASVDDVQKLINKLKDPKCSNTGKASCSSAVTVTSWTKFKTDTAAEITKLGDRITDLEKKIDALPTTTSIQTSIQNSVYNAIVQYHNHTQRPTPSMPETQYIHTTTYPNAYDGRRWIYHSISKRETEFKCTHVSP
jgi:hypothetical protein